MSNRTVKNRIEKALIDFESNQINIKALKACIKLNGNAFEAMPYELIKEIDEIEYQLTQCLYADEEECGFEIDPALSLIREWLCKVPN